MAFDEDDSSLVVHEIVTIIDQNFMAVVSPDMADTMMTTLEIFDELQACFPSEKLTPGILAEQLQSLGFRLHMLSAMHLVWLMTINKDGHIGNNSPSWSNCSLPKY